MLLFILSLIVPVYFNLGPLRISPSRLFVLATIGPLLYAWLSGKAGKIRFADLMVILYGLWIILAMTIESGAERFQYSVMISIETICPYLFARVFVRSLVDYQRALKLLLWIAVLLVPAAVVESITNVMPYSILLENFGSTFQKADHYPTRLGFFRAQTVFEHPILFGMFVSSLFAPVYALSSLRENPAIMVRIQILPILVGTFFSLSSGAWMCLIVQIVLMAWNEVFKTLTRRWYMLSIILILGYTAIDLLSNRTPFQVFASYLTFDAHTAYWRMLIFEFGMQNVLANPIFGLGLEDWVRPEWMISSSVDNFWLLTAMRYGIPAFTFIAFALISVLITMIMARPSSTIAKKFRDAHAFSLVALAIAILTVHLWSATYVYFMFLLGAGIWTTNSEEMVPPKRQGASARKKR